MLSIDGTQEFFNRLFQINIKVNSYVRRMKFGLDNDRSMMTLLFLMFDKTLKYQNKRFYSLILCFFFLSMLKTWNSKSKQTWWRVVMQFGLVSAGGKETPAETQLADALAGLSFCWVKLSADYPLKPADIFACFSNAEGFCLKMLRITG